MELFVIDKSLPAGKVEYNVYEAILSFWSLFVEVFILRGLFKKEGKPRLQCSLASKKSII
jgi:hypothetical protein